MLLSVNVLKSVCNDYVWIYQQVGELYIGWVHTGVGGCVVWCSGFVGLSVRIVCRMSGCGVEWCWGVWDVCAGGPIGESGSGVCSCGVDGLVGKGFV